ncbi:MAG TPA: hypothetical protein VIT01_20490 [Acidimicrobiales bacterium]|jgi:biotin carboxyl carrier protein
MYDGETVLVAERVIVSPSSGVFVPADNGPDVAEGAVIGHVEGTGDRRVPVTSPFAGRVMRVVAWPGERVFTHDRIAWMRAA